MAPNGPQRPPTHTVGLNSVIFAWFGAIQTLIGPYGSKTAIKHQTFDTSLTFWSATRSKKDKMEIFLHPPGIVISLAWGKKKLYFLHFSQSYGGWKSKVSKKGLNFKKSTPKPPKIDLFRAKTISPTYLGINLGIYDQKVQIWTGPQKDKWT